MRKSPPHSNRNGEKIIADDSICNGRTPTKNQIQLKPNTPKLEKVSQKCPKTPNNNGIISLPKQKVEKSEIISKQSILNLQEDMCRSSITSTLSNCTPDSNHSNPTLHFKVDISPPIDYILDDTIVDGFCVLAFETEADIMAYTEAQQRLKLQAATELEQKSTKRKESSRKKIKNKCPDNDNCKLDDSRSDCPSRDPPSFSAVSPLITIKPDLDSINACNDTSRLLPDSCEDDDGGVVMTPKSPLRVVCPPDYSCYTFPSSDDAPRASPPPNLSPVRARIRTPGGLSGPPILCSEKISPRSTGLHENSKSSSNNHSPMVKKDPEAPHSEQSRFNGKHSLTSQSSTASSIHESPFSIASLAPPSPSPRSSRPPAPPTAPTTTTNGGSNPRSTSSTPKPRPPSRVRDQTTQPPPLPSFYSPASVAGYDHLTAAALQSHPAARARFQVPVSLPGYPWLPGLIPPGSNPTHNPSAVFPRGGPSPSPGLSSIMQHVNPSPSLHPNSGHPHQQLIGQDYFRAEIDKRFLMAHAQALLNGTPPAALGLPGPPAPFFMGQQGPPTTSLPSHQNPRHHPFAGLAGRPGEMGGSAAAALAALRPQMDTSEMSLQQHMMDKYLRSVTANQGIQLPGMTRGMTPPISSLSTTMPSGPLQPSSASQPAPVIPRNFQSKNGMSFNGVQPQQLLKPSPFGGPEKDRDQEKATPRPSDPTRQKKHGRWCDMHVQIAWRIYKAQQGHQSSHSSSNTLQPPPETKPLPPPPPPISLAPPPLNPFLHPGQDWAARQQQHPAAAQWMANALFSQMGMRMEMERHHQQQQQQQQAVAAGAVNAHSKLPEHSLSTAGHLSHSHHPPDAKRRRVSSTDHHSNKTSNNQKTPASSSSSTSSKPSKSAGSSIPSLPKKKSGSTTSSSPPPLNLKTAPKPSTVSYHSVSSLIDTQPHRKVTSSQQQQQQQSTITSSDTPTPPHGTSTPINQPLNICVQEEDFTRQRLPNGHVISPSAAKPVNKIEIRT